MTQPDPTPTRHTDGPDPRPTLGITRIFLEILRANVCMFVPPPD